jgi:Flp pilus assembly CpaF family ATPase
VIRIESRPAEAFPAAGHPLPAVTMRDLLRAALRHRPDRIILGEVRGPEAFDLLQAWNSGHPGSLSTIHADSSRLALAKLASLALQTGPTVSRQVITLDVYRAVQIVVQLARVGCSRRVSEICDVSRSFTPELVAMGR